MKKEVAEQWITALRSGKYQQCQDYLSKDGKYCCLGVLCEISGAYRKRIERLIDDDVGVVVVYDDSVSLPPTSVQVWADLVTVAIKGVGALDILNDSGKTFDEIADIIEEHWEEL